MLPLRRGFFLPSRTSDRSSSSLYRRGSRRNQAVAVRNGFTCQRPPIDHRDDPYDREHQPLGGTSMIGVMHSSAARSIEGHNRSKVPHVGNPGAAEEHLTNYAEYDRRSHTEKYKVPELGACSSTTKGVVLHEARLHSSRHLDLECRSWPYGRVQIRRPPHCAAAKATFNRCWTYHLRTIRAGYPLLNNFSHGVSQDSD